MKIPYDENGVRLMPGEVVEGIVVWRSENIQDEAYSEAMAEIERLKGGVAHYAFAAGELRLENKRLKEKITLLESDKAILVSALKVQSEISAAERARNTQ